MVEFENAQVSNRDAVDYAANGRSLGQTFVIRRIPLKSIQLWMKPADGEVDPNSVVTVRVQEAQNGGKTFFSGALSYTQIQNSYPVLIGIPELDLVADQPYRIEIEADGEPIWVYGQKENLYPYGNAWLNGTMLDADLAFRFTYTYTVASFVEDLRTIGGMLWLVIPLGLCLFLPGWLVLHTTGKNQNYEPADGWAISTGLSIAIVAVVLTWSSQVGVKWSRESIWGIFGGLALLTGAIKMSDFRRNRKKQAITPSGEANVADGDGILAREFEQNPGEHEKKNSSNIWVLIILVMIVIAGLYVRIAMIRDLSVPAWVDAIHHTLVTRMILESGNLPTTFLPYAVTASSNYHTGYHLLSAVYVWLSGQELSEAMLVFGQVLNAIMAIEVYLFTVMVTQNRKAGLAAAMISMLITPMPAYYTSWGRYTQLAGLIILPAAAMLTVKCFSEVFHRDANHKNGLGGLPWLDIGLAAVAWAGLALVHIRALVFLVALMAAYGLTNSRNWYSTLRVQWKKSLAILGGMGAIGFVIAAPSLLPVLGQLLPQRIGEQNILPAVALKDLPWRYITAGAGIYSIYLAGVGFVFALLFHRKFAATILLWAGMMWLAANPQLFRLEEWNFINNDSVFITAFLPLSALGGYAAGKAIDVARKKLPESFGVIFSILIAIFYLYIGIQGSKTLLPIINPGTIFTTANDIKAARWVEGNIDREATILINPELWGYGLYVGGDGGYWLSPVSGRKTFPPTLLYAFGNKTEILAINESARQLYEIADQPEAVASFMDTREIQYVFTGTKSGVISGARLARSGLFDVVYQQDGVWVLRLKN